jgi:REP element-mobilizing transposase RayT
LLQSRAAATSAIRKGELRWPVPTPNFTTTSSSARKTVNPSSTRQSETELHKYIAGIIRNLEGNCIEINGTQGHLHILAIIPPKISISEALRAIKASSSKWLHELKPTMSNFSWQDGYSAFTVSASQASRFAVTSVTRSHIIRRATSKQSS